MLYIGEKDVRVEIANESMQSFTKQYGFNIKKDIKVLSISKENSDQILSD